MNELSDNFVFNKEPKRIHYLMAVLITIVFGLASRYFDTLPNLLAHHAGDTLWAMMVYFLFRFFFVHKSPYASIYLSLIFCFLIEFSQLYQAPWINTIRGTFLGALILGKGFLVVDLIRYSLGIVFSFMIDKWICILKEK